MADWGWGIESRIELGVMFISFMKYEWKRRKKIGIQRRLWKLFLNLKTSLNHSGLEKVWNTHSVIVVFSLKRKKTLGSWDVPSNLFQAYFPWFSEILHASKHAHTFLCCISRPFSDMAHYYDKKLSRITCMSDKGLWPIKGLCYQPLKAL